MCTSSLSRVLLLWPGHRTLIPQDPSIQDRVWMCLWMFYVSKDFYPCKQWEKLRILCFFNMWYSRSRDQRAKFFSDKIKVSLTSVFHVGETVYSEQSPCSRAQFWEKLKWMLRGWFFVCLFNSGVIVMCLRNTAGNQCPTMLRRVGLQVCNWSRAIESSSFCCA